MREKNRIQKWIELFENYSEKVKQEQKLKSFGQNIKIEEIEQHILADIQKIIQENNISLKVRCYDDTEVDKLINLASFGVVLKPDNWLIRATILPEGTNPNRDLINLNDTIEALKDQYIDGIIAHRRMEIAIASAKDNYPSSLFLKNQKGNLKHLSEKTNQTNGLFGIISEYLIGEPDSKPDHSF
ncbi:MAG: hypothetical protein EP298_01735 [Gammaproteobacteria bacterium]|nr:MAG: hypothetical protein EP298_01735 [Gammaproteobacteria bacterium]UTW43926.1 hypothetical protein KFE69_07505 [bacterium SCSIO 12844]